MNPYKLIEKAKEIFESLDDHTDDKHVLLYGAMFGLIDQAERICSKDAKFEHFISDIDELREHIVAHLVPESSEEKISSDDVIAAFGCLKTRYHSIKGI